MALEAESGAHGFPVEAWGRGGWCGYVGGLMEGHNAELGRRLDDGILPYLRVLEHILA